MGSTDDLLQQKDDVRAGEHASAGAEHSAEQASHGSDRCPATRAELAILRAQLRSAKARKDTDSERVAGTALARRLVSLGTQLDIATRLARRSLLLGEDPRLREELSGWFASLGRLGLAAGTLEPLLERQISSTDRARLWVRIAVLRARAGEAALAAEALQHAADADPRDPLPLELYGASRSWAGSVISVQQAADALMLAAERREQAGEERAALEDVLQTVLLLPGHREAVERMGRHLTVVGRPQAADEVWRRSVEGLPVRDERTRGVHWRRLRSALDAQLPAVALGAALDLEADRELDLESISNALELVNDGSGFVPIPTFDGMLHCLGLTEWLLARAEHVAQRSAPDARAALTLQAAQVLAGPLSQLERVPSILIECLLADPGRDDVFAALQQYSTSTGDLSPIVDAIVGMGRGRSEHPATRRRLEQLATLSERGLRDPSAGIWALDKLAQAGPLPAELVSLRAQLMQRLEDVPPPSPDDWSKLSMAELRRMLDLLAQRPSDSELYALGLTEMCERDPAGLRWFRLLERLLTCLGREDEVQQLWERQLTRGVLDAAVCRVGLLRSYRRQAHADRALLLMSRATDISSAEEAAYYVVAASELGSDVERATALSLIGRTAKPAVRATLLALAAGIIAKSGEKRVAREMAELACRADAETARAFVCCADNLGATRSRVAGLVFERACRMALPRIEWCKALAEVADQQGNRAQRLKWLRRWASVAPLDAQAASELLSELSLGHDAESLEGAVDWLLGQPRPSQDLLVPIANATRRLAQLAPSRARALARRLIGVYGVAAAELTSVIEELTDDLRDPALRVALLERQVVQAGSSAQRAQLLLESARLRVLAEDPDQALDNLSQALSCGADSAAVRDVLESVGSSPNADAQLLLLEIRLALAAQGAEQGESPVEVERALDEQRRLRRELAFAYRDLAADRELACELLEANVDDSPGSWESLFRDWVSILGYAEASAKVEQQCKKLSVEAQVGLRSVAGRIALQDNKLELAVQLASPALELSPLQTDVLNVLENALPLEATAELEDVYRRVHSALLGPYGERALHYRAAREFERRNDRRRALQHAVAAFEAVPALGIPFALMSRLAEALGERGCVESAIQRVARSAVTPEQRAFWMDRAVQSAAQDADSLVQRLEVLLRALAVRADADSVERVGHVLTELLGVETADRDDLHRRFDTAIRASLRGFEGVGAAPVAVAAAVVADQVFDDSELVASYLGLAVELEPESAALDQVSRFERTLKDDAAAGLVLSIVLQQVDGGRAVSAAFLRFCRSLAERSRPSATPTIAVALAKAVPGDREAVAFARRSVGSDSELIRQLQEVVAPEERAQTLLTSLDGVAVPSEQAQRLDESVRKLRPDSSWFDSVLERLLQLSTDEAAVPTVEATLAYLIAQDNFGTSHRARAVRRLASLLSQRGANAQALDVLGELEAWRESTAEDQRQGAEIARQLMDEERELGFLAQLEHQQDLGSDQERAAVLSRIAELHAAVGSRKQATHYYERVLALEADNASAQQFLLEDAERSEDFAALAVRLEEQLSANRGEPEVALRLYQLYTQRLGQPEQGQAVLERALMLHGDNEDLLCALAEHLDEAGQDSAAGQVYQRAGRGSRQGRRASHFAELACRSYLKAGDDDSVRAILAVKGLFPNTQALTEMRVELARKHEEYEELAHALEELSVVSKEAAAVRAGFLLEAAQISLDRLGNFERALALSERGARMAPNDAVLQLYTRMLQYRKRGAGTRQDALYTITELRSLRPSIKGGGKSLIRELSTEEARAEVRAFLLAEALRQRSGSVAGLRELVETAERYGPSPLLALGLAERLRDTGDAEKRLAALDYFRTALSGDLYGFRSPAEVAMQAAEFALFCSEPNQALELARLVPTDAPEFAAAKALIDQIQASSTPPRKPLSQRRAGLSQEGSINLEPIPAGQPPGFGEWTGAVSAMAAELAGSTRLGMGVVVPAGTAAPVARIGLTRLPVAQARPRMPTSPGLGRPEGGVEAFESAESALARAVAETTNEVQVKDRAPRTSVLGRPPPKPGMRAETSVAELSPAPAAPRPLLPLQPAVVVRPSVAVGFSDAGSAPEPETDQREDVHDPLSEAPASARRSLLPSSASEARLMAALVEGSLDAGDELRKVLEREPSRNHELVAVCRLLAHWVPGDTTRLRDLHQAVIADNDPVYARALLHAQRAMSEPANAPVAPPLHRQLEHVDAVVKLLAGPCLPGHEALGLLWQHTPDLFRNNAPSPITERRVEPGSGTALGELLTEVSRLFGCARVGVYEAVSPEPPEFELVLAHPAALIVRGLVVAEAPTFRYHFGRMMFATRPEYALVFGLEAEELHTVLHAVGVGFGPPRPLVGEMAHVAQLAERLWEMLPPHVQRRLSELCEHQRVLEPEIVLEGARRALRRAGLFVCGDLSTALDEVVAAEGMSSESQSLRALCEQSESVADLVRFATSLEYADARWRSGVSRSSLDRLARPNA